VDDSARVGDEGRGKLRNAAARRMQPLNRRFPNETSHFIPQGKRTQGSKALQYLKEEKSIEMLLVRATEHSLRQTESLLEIVETCGVTRLVFHLSCLIQSLLESNTIEGDSPVE
jgi:hypothetical protein